MDGSKLENKKSKKIKLSNLVNSPLLSYKHKCNIVAPKIQVKRLSKAIGKSNNDSLKKPTFNVTCNVIDSVEGYNDNESKNENLTGKDMHESKSPVVFLSKRKTRKAKKKKLESSVSSSNVKPSIIKMSFDNKGLSSELKFPFTSLKTEKTTANLVTHLTSTDPGLDSSSHNQNKLSALFDWPQLKLSNRSSNQDCVLNTTNIDICDKEEFINKPTNSENSLYLTNTTVNIYELTGCNILVVLKPEALIYIVGIIELELIKGSIEVLGYNLNKPKNKLIIFSLQGSCHLFLKAKPYNTSLKSAEKTNISLEDFVALGLTEKTSKKLLKEVQTSTFLLINRKNNHKSSIVWPKFFENHLPFSIFPPKDLLLQETRPFHTIEHKIECLFERKLHELGLKEYKELAEWSMIEKDLLSQDFPKAILCGGKSVGKSTLLRFLINKCLQKWQNVLVLDFDLGQCEFTVGGCIAVTLVEEPVLGPNYSHLKEPLKCVFLGEVDVTKCPENYINGVKFLIDYARQTYSNIPWLINTMGFTRGFGVTLNCGIIKTVSPTDVIQIESKDNKINFPSKLKPKFVYLQSIDSFGKKQETLDYKLHVVSSGSEAQRNSSQKSRGISPAEARNLVILSYFSEMLSTEKSSLSQVTPYMINMEQIALHTTGKDNLTKTQVAATMNGNMVALCHLTKRCAIPNCHGFGIVRGIDWKTGILYLITPIPINTLSKVNCLIKGSVGLPESLYFNQGEGINGHVPYLAHTSGSSTARFARREFRPPPTASRDDTRRQPPQ